VLVLREGLGGDDGRAIVSPARREIHLVIHVAQLSLGKGILSRGVMQTIPHGGSGPAPGPAVRPQRVRTAREQKIQYGPGWIRRHDLLAEFTERVVEDREARQPPEFPVEGVQDRAEGRLGVGGSHRVVVALAAGREGRQSPVGGFVEHGNVSIVGEAPLDAPHFAREGVDVGKIDVTYGGKTDVPHHVQGFYGVFSQELC